MKNNKLMFIVAMVIFGTLAPFVRNVPLSSAEIAFYRCLQAAIIVGGFILLNKKKIPFDCLKKALPFLIISGAALGLNWIFLFEAYKYTTVSTATISYYFAPIVVMLVTPILFKERLGVKQILCFIVSTVGIVLITFSGKPESGENDFIGILFGLSAALLYACLMIFNKYIKGIDGVYRTLFQFIIACVVLLPYVLVTSGLNLSVLDLKGIINLAILGVLHTGIAYLLYFSSIAGLSGQNMAILSYIDPLVAVFVSLVFLDEAMSLLQIAGGVLVLGAAIFNEIDINKKDDSL